MLEEVECPFSSRSHITPEINQFVFLKKNTNNVLVQTNHKIGAKKGKGSLFRGNLINRGRSCLKNKLTHYKNDSDRFDGNDLVEKKEVPYKRKVSIVTSVHFQARGGGTSLLFKWHLYIPLESVDTHWGKALMSYIISKFNSLNVIRYTDTLQCRQQTLVSSQSTDSPRKSISLKPTLHFNSLL